MRTLLPIVALTMVSAPVPTWASETDVSTSTVADPRHPTASVEVVEVDGDAGDDLAGALDDVSGVHARRTSFGQTAFLTIRGSNSRQVLVETEGIRLNPPFGAGFDLSTATLGFDSAAVWRGAAATYRGSGAVAGALELRTRHLDTPGLRLRASSLGGSYGTREGTLDLTVASESTSARLAIAGRGSEGDFAFVDEQGTSGRRVNNDHERVGVFGSVESSEGRGWMRATVFTTAGERGTAGPVEFQDEFGAARLEDSQTTAIVSVGAYDLLSGPDWAVDGTLRAGAQNRDYSYRNPEPFLDGPPIFEETRSDSLHAVSEAELWLPASVGRLALDARRETWVTEEETERLSFGVGVSWEQTLGSWTAAAGLRGDADSDDRQAVSPSIGAAWTRESWGASANLGRTFRSPNLDELYLDLESIRGNPDLDSETAWVADLGATWASESFGASLTGFGRVVDSEILFLPVTAYLVQAQNVQGTWAAGAEAAAHGRVGLFGGRVSYTFTHARFTEGNAPVPLTPAHDAVIRLSAFPGWFELWTEGKLRGEITLDNFGNSRDEAHLLWDAGVALRPAKGWEASFVARNLTDDQRMVDAAQQPVPGRTLWVRLTGVWESD